MARTLGYNRPLFVEEQRLLSMSAGGTIAIVVVAAPTIPAVIITWNVLSGGFHRVWIWLPLMLVGMIVPACMLFSRAVTIVEAGQVRLAVFAGPVRVWRKVIALGTVRGCALVQPDGEVLERPGWKLPRFSGLALLKFVGGDAYVMVRGGQPTVVLTMARFGGIVLGSERPEELVEAIHTATNSDAETI